MLCWNNTFARDKSAKYLIRENCQQKTTREINFRVFFLPVGYLSGFQTSTDSDIRFLDFGLIQSDRLIKY